MRIIIQMKFEILIYIQIRLCDYRGLENRAQNKLSFASNLYGLFQVSWSREMKMSHVTINDLEVNLGPKVDVYVGLMRF